MIKKFLKKSIPERIWKLLSKMKLAIVVNCRKFSGSMAFFTSSILKRLGEKTGWRKSGKYTDNLSSIRGNWEKLGEGDPMWAVLTHPEKTGNRWQEDEFFTTGRLCVEHVMKVLNDRNHPSSRKRALDFGCGVGRLSFALADFFDTVDGVDISKTMIERARNFNPHGERCRFHLVKSPPLPFDDGTFDLVFSFIVLQHMRTEYALAYVSEFIRLLRPDGAAYFQSPTRFLVKDDINFSFANHNMKEGSARIEMHAHSREKIESTVEKAGGSIIETFPDHSAGDAFESVCYLVGRKNAPQTQEA